MHLSQSARRGRDADLAASHLPHSISPKVFVGVSRRHNLHLAVSVYTWHLSQRVKPIESAACTFDVVPQTMQFGLFFSFRTILGFFLVLMALASGGGGHTANTPESLPCNVIGGCEGPAATDTGNAEGKGTSADPFQKPPPARGGGDSDEDTHTTASGGLGSGLGLGWGLRLALGFGSRFGDGFSSRHFAFCSSGSALHWFN